MEFELLVVVAPRLSSIPPFLVFCSSLGHKRLVCRSCPVNYSKSSQPQFLYVATSSLKTSIIIMQVRLAAPRTCFSDTAARNASGVPSAVTHTQPRSAGKLNNACGATWINTTWNPMDNCVPLFISWEGSSEAHLVKQLQRSQGIQHQSSAKRKT